MSKTRASLLDRMLTAVSRVSVDQLNKIPRFRNQMIAKYLARYMDDVEGQLEASGFRLADRYENRPELTRGDQGTGITPQRIRDIIDGSPEFPTRFSPVQGNNTSWILQKESTKPETDPASGLPVPPMSLRIYPQETPYYLKTGKKDIDALLKLVEGTGFTLGEGQRVLDIGCSTGRMIRHLNDYAAQCEIWGCDIDEAHILWNQRYLSPPFSFIANTTYPHLPFEDRYFDLIYAGSVFTHIAELTGTWLMELRRILRPGGRFYCTMQDQSSIALLSDDSPQSAYINSSSRSALLGFKKHFDFSAVDFDMFAWRSVRDQPHIFYDLDFLKHVWGRYFDILHIEPEAYGFQTAVIMTRPE